MHRYPIKFITLFFSLVFASNVLSSGVSPQQLTEYEAFFRQAVKDNKFPGAAFAIVSRDKILHISTVGHTTAAGNQAIDQQTTFRIASVSKTFAAEVVGLLVEDGSLNWDDPVTRYVPAFKINGDTSQMQIQHVLGQSTGIIPHAYDNLLEDGKSMQEIWLKMRNLPYTCAPGDCYGYQNSVFSLVEPIVQKATSMPYNTLIEQRIFKPLDMQTASLGYQAFVSNPNHAEPHAKAKNGWRTVKVQPNYYRAAPAAGVNASILDMGKWVQAQLGSHPRVLSSEMVGNLHKPRMRTRRQMYRKEWKSMLSNAYYGLGWRVYQVGKEQLIYHGGWVSGFRADVAFSPTRDIGIVVLLNAESSRISELTTRFWKMALADEA
ncbi:MAG: beta-lactamase family protein [Proteobacteria bacterium]|nr:beta-lactamase family protein [Pseudomonadota bacterium]